MVSAFITDDATTLRKTYNLEKRLLSLCNKLEEIHEIEGEDRDDLNLAIDSMSRNIDQLEDSLCANIEALDSPSNT